MGIGASNLGGMMSSMQGSMPSSTATPNTNANPAQPAPQSMGGKGAQVFPAQRPNFTPMPMVPEGAMSQPHPFQGMPGMQQQIMEHMESVRRGPTPEAAMQIGQRALDMDQRPTGQQITDPATGRNFTIGGPMTMDFDTGLAYQRAMEAFNESNQQQINPGATNQTPAQQSGGEAQQVAQQQMEAMLRARQQLTPQQRNPYVDQGYFQGRMQQPMMSPYQQPFMQRMAPQMMMGGYGMPPMMGGFGGFGGYGMPMGGFGGYGMPQPMGGKGFNPMMYRGF